MSAISGMSYAATPTNQIILPNAQEATANALQIPLREYTSPRVKFLQINLITNNGPGRVDATAPIIDTAIHSVLRGPTAIGGFDTGGQVFFSTRDDVVVRYIRGVLGLPGMGDLVFITDDFLLGQYTAAFNFIEHYIKVSKADIYIVGPKLAGILRHNPRLESLLNVAPHLKYIHTNIDIQIQHACSVAISKATANKKPADLRFFDHMLTIAEPFKFPFPIFESVRSSELDLRVQTPLYSTYYVRKVLVSQTPMTTILFQTICKTVGEVLRGGSSSTYSSLNKDELSKCAPSLVALLDLFPFRRKQNDINEQFYYFTPYVVCGSGAQLKKYINHHPHLAELWSEASSSRPVDIFDSHSEPLLNAVYKSILGDVAQLLNALSLLQGLDPVYTIANPPTMDIAADYKKNGYRLLTSMEYLMLGKALPLSINSTVKDAKGYEAAVERTQTDLNLGHPQSNAPTQDIVTQINDIQPNQLGFIGLRENTGAVEIADKVMFFGDFPTRQSVETVHSLLDSTEALRGQTVQQTEPLDYIEASVGYVPPNLSHPLKLLKSAKTTNIEDIAECLRFVLFFTRAETL